MRSRGVVWFVLAGSASACVVPGLEVADEPLPQAGVSGGSRSPSVTAGASGSAGLAGEAPSGATSHGGGSAATDCDARPVSPKSEWTVTASSSSLGSGVEGDPLYNPPAHVTDGSLDERWASGTPQEADGQWFHVDFGRDVAVSEVTLQQGQSLRDFPRGFAISLSHRHTDFEARACAQGTGAPVSEQVIPLGERAVGRYLMIRQTGSSETWWSIAELDVACHD